MEIALFILGWLACGVFSFLVIQRHCVRKWGSMERWEVLLYGIGSLVFGPVALFCAGVVYLTNP